MTSMAKGCTNEDANIEVSSKNVSTRGDSELGSCEDYTTNSSEESTGESECQHNVGLNTAEYIWGDEDDRTETTEELGEGAVLEHEYNGMHREKQGVSKISPFSADLDLFHDVVGLDHLYSQARSKEAENRWENKIKKSEGYRESSDENFLPHKAGSSAEKNENHLHSVSEEMAVDIGNEAPEKASKFVFLSDQKDVPVGLRRLQERTMRRRRDLLARMHSLDCQLAKVSSNYAEEKMNLDLAIRDTLDRSVSQPLEAAAERLVMEREASLTRGRGVGSLEQRLEKLDSQMIQHIYIKLGDHRRSYLDNLHLDLFQDVVPGINIENSKFNKVEFGVVRRFEEIAGSVSRNFHRECGTFRGDIQRTRTKVNNAAKTEGQRLDYILVAISELRARTRRERAQRREADAQILQRIVDATVSMKRALLEAVGSSE